MNEELKPCKICGDKAIICSYDGGVTDILCNSVLMCLNDTTGWYRSINEATGAWNKRNSEKQME